MDIPTLQSKTRKRHIVQARQLAMFFAKKYTKASLASIGSQIGKRDHATVLHACKTVDNLSSTDKQFRKFVEDLGKSYPFNSIDIKGNLYIIPSSISEEILYRLII